MLARLRFSRSAEEVESRYVFRPCIVQTPDTCLHVVVYMLTTLISIGEAVSGARVARLQPDGRFEEIEPKGAGKMPDLVPVSKPPSGAHTLYPDWVANAPGFLDSGVRNTTF